MKAIGLFAALWVLVDSVRHPEKDIGWVIRRMRLLQGRAEKRGESLYTWRPA